LGDKRDIVNQLGEGVGDVATGTRRTFQHVALGWRLSVRYHGDATSHNKSSVYRMQTLHQGQ